MDEESRQQALRLLEELVLDAGEAVSYRRLAGALCLHVNRSKALLQEFVDQHETAHQLSISVLVCGTTSDGGACTKLCSRGELESVRISLKPVLFEHIYAVSRASAALEEAALAAAVGGFDDFTPTIGAISSAVCVKRSQEEIGSLKVKSYKALANDAASVVGISTKNAKNKLSPVLKTDPKNLIDAATSAPVADPNNLTKKSSVTAPAPTVKKEVKSIAQGTSNKNISNFFRKSNGQPVTKHAPKIKEEHKEIKTEPKETLKAANGSVEEVVAKATSKAKQDETPNKKKEEKTDNTANRKTVKSEVKKEQSKKKKSTNHKNGKVDKKRKRVVLMSDSDDSEEEKEDPFEEPPTANATLESDDEDVIPPTPNADVVKITSGIVNPKKRRKIIDKTYTTEDGYMVTRKEEVLESFSEDEVDMKENIVEINVKKEIVIEKKTPAPASKSKKKFPSPQKGKQASIMSFFKKKP